MAKIAGHEINGDKEVADTLQCVHCSAHWRVERGSGIRRGWCMNCNGPVCGPRCKECVPVLKKLELYEKGLLRSL